FPSQIKRFFSNLNQRSVRSHSDTSAYGLLIDSHLNQLPHEVLPDYTYEELNKGVFCSYCFQKINPRKGKFVVCHNCKQITTIQEVIRLNVMEFATLFPSKKITAHSIYLWLDGFFNKQTIIKYLKLLFIHHPNGKFSYYTLE